MPFIQNLLTKVSILFKEIIIYFFEKYSFDYWVTKQQDEEKRDIMSKYDLHTEEEYQDYLSDKRKISYNYFNNINI